MYQPSFPSLQTPAYLLAGACACLSVALGLTTAKLNQPTAGEPQYQLFVDVDGSTTGYSRFGYDLVCRLTLDELDWGPGGWGPVVAEGYINDEWVATCPCQLALSLNTFDANFDGKIDLDDYAEFQRVFEEQ